MKAACISLALAGAVSFLAAPAFAQAQNEVRIPAQDSRTYPADPAAVPSAPPAGYQPGSAPPPPPPYYYYYGPGYGPPPPPSYYAPPPPPPPPYDEQPADESQGTLDTIPVVPIYRKPEYHGLNYGFAVSSGFAFGGDKVATLYYRRRGYDDYRRYHHENIRAGEGADLLVGGFISPSRESPFSARFLVGYKYDGFEDSRSDINLGRVPLQLVGSYRLPWSGFHVGAGVVGETGIELHGDGYFHNVKFDDEIGPRAEIGWRFLSVNYTYLRYHASHSSDSFDAESVGVEFTWEFGRTRFSSN